MAQQLNSINLVAPAFKGINTEDSPLAQDPSFAEIADNAVIAATIGAGVPGGKTGGAAVITLENLDEVLPKFVSNFAKLE